MIRLAMRLAVAGGREAILRLAIIAVAVALGVGMLLGILAGLNAVQLQGDRYAILNTGEGTPGEPGADPLWWSLRTDMFDNTVIDRIDLAATGPNSPVPPGIPRLPGPGEYFVSPALARRLATTPADELGNRYPGHQVGIIGRETLASPDRLMIIIGRTSDEVAAIPFAAKVNGIETDAPDVWIWALNLILAVTGAGLLFPVLIFIGTATRLAATRREQRFAAMRLVGATPRQISTIAATEATVAAMVGTALGFGLFPLVRDWLAGIPFTGEVFYPDEVALTPLGVVGVAGGVPAAAAVAARFALHRVRVSPLGVSRRVTPKPPRAYRLLVLVVGLAELGYFIGNRPETGIGQTAAYLPGLLLIMAGLVVAGPWFTMLGARMLARRANRPATLLSARRLADNPQAAFRAISGVVLALFVTTVATAVITTIVANRGSHMQGAGASSAVFSYMDSDTVEVPASVNADLAATPGVGNLLVLRSDPDAERGRMPTVVACADLEKTAVYGHCESGAQVASIWPGLDWDDNRSTVWPTSSIPLADLPTLPVYALLVQTDGSRLAIERTRTVLLTTFPAERNPPITGDEHQVDFVSTLTGWKRLANLIILASLPIAGCSLAVSVAGGLSDRRRPFSLLRLSGVQVRVLRRVVALESAVPLLLVAVVAIAAGLLTAELFLQAQLGYTLVLPGGDFWLLIGGSLVVALAVIGSTLPLLERITGPETARNG
ncbi:ABC transporter permease [Virgisporangium aurantiacum]